VMETPRQVHVVATWRSEHLGELADGGRPRRSRRAAPGGIEREARRLHGSAAPRDRG
jgi:hypothetical protein